jgi:hypothetical protein
MWNRRVLSGVAVTGIVAVGGLVAVACGGGGVSQSEFDRVQQERNDLQAQNEQLKAQGGASQTTPAAGTTPAANATAAPGGITLLIGAVKKAAAPTPTPLPPGAVAPTAAPRETPPPSTYQKAGDFYVYVETLATTTTSKYEVASSIACTPSGAFARGQRIVFRYDIVDLSTGIRLNDKDGSVVKVVLPNGDESTGRFGQRGGGSVPGAPFMFSSNWDIPLDYALGGIDYKIVITAKDGRTMTWKPPALVAAGGNDTRPKVVQ